MAQTILEICLSETFASGIRERRKEDLALKAMLIPDAKRQCEVRRRFQIPHTRQINQISVLKTRISELEREQEEFRHKKAWSLCVPSPNLSGLPQDLFLRVLHDNSAGVGP